MAVYNFAAAGNKLAVDLVAGGDFPAKGTIYAEPGVQLTPSSIKLTEGGKLMQTFLYQHFNQIAGVAPTSLADAYAKLKTLIGTL